MRPLIAPTVTAGILSLALSYPSTAKGALTEKVTLRPVRHEISLVAPSDPTNPLLTFFAPDFSAITIPRVGTGTLSLKSSTSLRNPDSTGLGDGAFIDIYYTGDLGTLPPLSTFDFSGDVSVTNTTRTRHGMQLALIVGGDDLDTSAYNDAIGTNPLYQGTGTTGVNPLYADRLALSNPQFTPGTNSDGSISSTFDLQFDLAYNGNGAIDPNTPLFEMSLDFADLPEPSFLGLALLASPLFLLQRRRAMIA